ncbi:IclR family transcriptional regulator C-terminal domain-containing protein [Jiulongibacter sediminis]|jgi:IclR family pca regulon transcriptional regulator|uniref:IclR family transcriptional regulator domain-containing protein n=1 Tax=Jiulongibacter sediminis TaxID=1605367 RepID=UPI0026F045BB|nr:IclR family transcriptional regulator C-terminal domain-containing protein [Jiulongibacter sediminis]
MEIKASDYVQSLDKGLRVLLVFSKEQRPLTLSEVAAQTQMSRAAARRFLLTFTHLGYMQTDGKHFSLTAKVLDLGYSYISSMDIIDIAKPFMLKLSQELNESCSIGEIQNTDIVYIVQEQVARVMTVSLKVGSRIPAHVTSMGRMILAMNEQMQEELLEKIDFTAYTSHTITDKDKLKAELAIIKKQGWAFVDEELEYGLRAISTPIFSKDGSVKYAMTIVSTTNRTGKEEMLYRFLPAMQKTCQEISLALGMM